MVVAELLPWACGAAVCRGILKGRSIGECIGAGWFVGETVAVATLYLLLRCGIQVSAWMAIAPVAIVGVVGLIAAAKMRANAIVVPAAPALSTGAWVLIVIAAALLAAKVALLGFVHFSPTILHDDAQAIWMYRAKVISGLGRLPLAASDPLYLGGTHADYPLFTSLAAAWVALVGGRWSDWAATVPWSLAYVNLLVLLFAVMRRRAGAAVAVVTCWAAGSAPLLFVHVMRPGYSDLLLAAFLAAGVVYLLDWRSDRAAVSLGLGLIFLAAAAWTKREGIVPAGIAAVVLVLPRVVRIGALSRAERVICGVGLAAGLIGAAVLGPSLMSGAGGGGWHPEALAILARHALAWSSFGLLWMLMAAAAIGAAIRNRSGGELVLVAGLVLYAIAVFAMTENVRFAHNDQTPSRVLLQVVPTLAITLAWALTGPVRESPRS